MNEDIKKLIRLQAIDRTMDAIHGDLVELPREIEEKKLMIQQNQTAQEEEKKKLVQTLVKRKEKEIELGSQEEKIRKHEGELNLIKSNASYRTMLSEIENAKKQQNQIEDDILNLMEEADLTSKELKRMEADSLEKKKQYEEEIRQIELRIKEKETNLESETKKREEFCASVPDSILSRYQFIRGKRKSTVLASIVGETCGSCHTMLTQSTINEVRKGKDLVSCDSCSTILYIPDKEISQPV